MNVMTLFRKSPSQSLIQAPSADLIQSDNELTVPEPEEIKTRMGVNEFDEYIKLVQSIKYSPSFLIGEGVLQGLKVNGCHHYPRDKIRNFMDKQAKYLSRTTGLSLKFQWCLIANYHKALPPRIVRKISNIKSSIPDFEDKKLDFWVTNFNDLPEKNGQEICFIAIDTNVDNKWSSTACVIDAWRGPTFSDEEAKI